MAHEATLRGSPPRTLLEALQRVFLGKSLQERLLALDLTVANLKGCPEDCSLCFSKMGGSAGLSGLADWNDCERCHSLANLIVALLASQEGESLHHMSIDNPEVLEQLANKLACYVFEPNLVESLQVVAVVLRAMSKQPLPNPARPLALSEERRFNEIFEAASAGAASSPETLMPKIRSIFSALSELPIVVQFRLLDKGPMSLVLYALATMELPTDALREITHMILLFTSSASVVCQGRHYRMQGEELLLAQAARCGVPQVFVAVLESGESRDEDIERDIVQGLGDLWLEAPLLRELIQHHVLVCARVLVNSSNKEVRRKTASLLRAVMSSTIDSSLRIQVESILMGVHIEGAIEPLKLPEIVDFGSSFSFSPAQVGLPRRIQLERGASHDVEFRVNVPDSILAWTVLSDLKQNIRVSVSFRDDSALPRENSGIDSRELALSFEQESQREMSGRVPLLSIEEDAGSGKIRDSPASWTVIQAPHELLIDNPFGSGSSSSNGDFRYVGYGRCICRQPGSYKFTLDNKHAWFRGMNAMYQTYVLSPDLSPAAPAAMPSADSRILVANGIQTEDQGQELAVVQAGTPSDGQLVPLSSPTQVAHHSGARVLCIWIRPQCVHIEAFVNRVSVVRQTYPLLNCTCSKTSLEDHIKHCLKKHSDLTFPSVHLTFRTIQQATGLKGSHISVASSSDAGKTDIWPGHSKIPSHASRIDSSMSIKKQAAALSEMMSLGGASVEKEGEGEIIADHLLKEAHGFSLEILKNIQVDSEKVVVTDIHLCLLSKLQANWVDWQSLDVIALAFDGQAASCGLCVRVAAYTGGRLVVGRDGLAGSWAAKNASSPQEALASCAAAVAELMDPHILAVFDLTWNLKGADADHHLGHRHGHKHKLEEKETNPELIPLLHEAVGHCRSEVHLYGPADFDPLRILCLEAPKLKTFARLLARRM